MESVARPSCCAFRRSQEDAEEGYQEAEAALEIMEEAEAEEAELEEVEDLLEYYLQRATTTQSEAERLLAGSRDLEESIGVSLSARRFEVRSYAVSVEAQRHLGLCCSKAWLCKPVFCLWFILPVGNVYRSAPISQLYTALQKWHAIKCERSLPGRDVDCILSF
jgi:hypothetical protein